MAVQSRQRSRYGKNFLKRIDCDIITVQKRGVNMADEKNYVTQAGYDALIAEHDNLVHNVRQQVIVELQEARAQGDLSENADYDAAREHQAQVEARILELDALIKNAEIIEESKDQDQANKIVKLGSTVTLKDLSENSEKTFDIVGSIEANPLEGKLSNLTPLAEAMMDKKVGDKVMVTRVDEPYEVEILKIS